MVVATPTDTSACCGHGVTVSRDNTTYICDKCGGETGLRAPTIHEQYLEKIGMMEHAIHRIKNEGLQKMIDDARWGKKNFLDIPWMLFYACEALRHCIDTEQRWGREKKHLEWEMKKLGEQLATHE